ncbi:hypothetical protein PLIIFM63780_008072 [Purpureocillium lilacinum]|nr:hypothetical protein PLIIFM63780_008072 [Purpureocillium lilacinum]
MLTQQQQQQQQIQHGRRLIFEKSKWATRWRRPGAVGAALIVVVSLNIIIRNSQLSSRIPSTIRSTTSQRPQTLNRGPTQRDWVDKEYLDENPWYGVARQKPVFSLGQPLPHTARRRHTEKRTTGKAGNPDVEAAETATTPEHEASQQDDQAVPHLFQDTNRFALDAEPLGYREREEVEEGFRDPDELRNWWASFRARHPELLAEFLATTVSIFLGVAGTLTVNLSADPSTIYGTFEAAWSSGFAWMLGIYIGGGVSGAHMNPAVSASLSVFRRFPWRQCAAYVLVQLLAAAAAGSLAYAVFRDAIRNADGPARETAWTAFCATRREWMSTGGAALSQVVQSAVMMIMVFALGDDQNDPPGAGMHAFILGLLVTTLKLTLGHNTGSALNPAADFGPRLVMLGVGYGRSVVFGDAWWVIGPWAANLAGALLGGIVYDGFIFVGSESPVNRRIKLSR